MEAMQKCTTPSLKAPVIQPKKRDEYRKSYIAIEYLNKSVECESILYDDEKMEGFLKNME